MDDWELMQQTRRGGAILSGLLLLVIVLGSLWMAMLDPDLQHAAAPHHPPTSTPFPTLPSALSPTPLPTPTMPPALVRHCSPPPGWVPYRVHSGETLVELAWRAGLSPYMLVRANCLGVMEVSAGETLYLPPTAAQPEATPSYQCGPPPGWRVIYVRPK